MLVIDGADSLEKSEVQAIIESTPELDMDLAGCRGTRYSSNLRIIMLTMNNMKIYIWIDISIDRWIDRYLYR